MRSILGANANISMSRLLVSVIFLSFVTLLLFRPPLESYPADELFASVHIVLTLVAIVCHFLVNRADENLARYDVLFLIGMLIVNFQWAVMMILLNIDFYDVSMYFLDVQLINYAVWLSSLAITSWILGYDLLYRQRATRIAHKLSCGLTESRKNRLKILTRLAISI